MKNALLYVVLLLTSIPVESIAQETQVIVRAKAKDAKFIGSSLGGAAIIIRDKQTGEILAQGKTSGTTGDTRKVMLTPHERGQKITDENTAQFFAAIDLQEPTFVQVQAISPVNHRGSQVVSSTELWLIPGKHILGDGIILEIPGFIIDLLSPRTHQYIRFGTIKNSTLPLQANIVMMCGCLIDKGGLWNSGDMEVRGIVKVNDKIITETPLSLVSPNLFEGEIPADSTGNYEVIVYAYDEKSGNTGVSKLNFVVH